MNGKALILIVFLALFIIVACSGGQKTQPQSESASVKVSGGLGQLIGVYDDQNLTVHLSAINWGVCYPGGSSSHTAWIRNEYTGPITLTFTAGNWTPAEASKIILTTNIPGGYQLAASEVLQVVFTITIPSNTTISDFSFNVLINASG